MAYLPGQFVEVSTSKHFGYGDTCCDCENEGVENIPAITALVGETDSFGSEFHPMCQKHKDEYLANLDKEAEEEPTGFCDWCKKGGVHTYPRRDFEEGSSGPVYYVCSPCISKDNERIQRELNEPLFPRHGYDDDYDYD